MLRALWTLVASTTACQALLKHLYTCKSIQQHSLLPLQVLSELLYGVLLVL